MSQSIESLEKPMGAGQVTCPVSVIGGHRQQSGLARQQHDFGKLAKVFRLRDAGEQAGVYVCLFAQQVLAATFPEFDLYQPRQ